VDVSYAIEKYRLTLEAYLRNTGQDYPHLKISINANLTSRAIGANALTAEGGGQLWQGSITVGTPPVIYNVDFDTGSSDIFLPGPNCFQYCSGYAIYNPTRSSTSRDQHKSYRLGYGDGSSVVVEEYTDTVQISGLSVYRLLLSSRVSCNSGPVLNFTGEESSSGRRVTILSRVRQRPFCP